jgi:hypothetical protein
MYCDDSSVKPVDSKQVVVRYITFFFYPCFFSNGKTIEPKGICSVLQKSSTLEDYQLVIQYSLSSNLLFGPLLVVTIICILLFALPSLDLRICSL